MGEPGKQSEETPADALRSVRLCLVISWLLLGLCVIPTITFASAMVTGNGAAAFISWFVAAAPLAVLFVVAGIIPNAVLYGRHRSRLSRNGLWLSGGALAMLSVEFIVLWFSPLNNEF